MNWVRAALSLVIACGAAAHARLLRSDWKRGVVPNDYQWLIKSQVWIAVYCATNAVICALS